MSSKNKAGYLSGVGDAVGETQASGLWDGAGCWGHMGPGGWRSSRRRRHRRKKCGVSTEKVVSTGESVSLLNRVGTAMCTPH